MNQNQTDQEIDAFFDWLIPQLPQNRPLRVPTPTPEMLDLAWQAAQAHQAYLINNGLAFSQFILPKAAADGAPKDKPREYKGKIEFKNGDNLVVGEYLLIREDLPADPAHQILRFKCSEELLPKYQGCTVTVVVAEQSFNLGKIDRRGSAKIAIPRNLDLDAGYYVGFGKRRG